MLFSLIINIVNAMNEMHFANAVQQELVATGTDSCNFINVHVRPFMGESLFNYS